MSEAEAVVQLPQTNSKLSFTFRELLPGTGSIIPRLRARIDVTHIVPPGQSAHSIRLIPSRSELAVLVQQGPQYIAPVIADQPFYTLAPATTNPCYLDADLDHFRLAQMEKLREGKDFKLQIRLSYIAEVQRQPPLQQPLKIQIEERVAKSDWAEKILPQLGFKEVALIEIPKIEKAEFGDSILKLNEAWKQYSMGEYDKVLTECRKAMEALATALRGKGFEREIEDEKGKRRVPDWRRALAHEAVGEIIESIVRKHFSFVAPGSHYGKAINREDAEFALLLTHGLVNLISKKVIT